MQVPEGAICPPGADSDAGISPDFKVLMRKDGARRRMQMTDDERLIDDERMGEHLPHRRGLGVSSERCTFVEDMVSELNC